MFVAAFKGIAQPEFNILSFFFVFVTMNCCFMNCCITINCCFCMEKVITFLGELCFFCFLIFSGCSDVSAVNSVNATLGCDQRGGIPVEFLIRVSMQVHDN